MLQSIKRALSKGNDRLQRGLAFAAFWGLAGFNEVMAADPKAGTTAFEGIEEAIKNYQTPTQKIVYAIAAVIAIVGAFNIFFKMQNGDQDVKKTVMLTLGGCIALVALATSLPSFFR